MSRTQNTKYKVGLLGCALFAAYSCGNDPQEALEDRESALENSQPSQEVQPRDVAAEGELLSACSGVRADVPFNRQPVDIILVSDNSASMTEEAQAIQDNINKSFATILESSGLDYRVIVVSRHGAFNGSTSKALCITQPLSTLATCSPVPVRPGNNPPKFFHYSRNIGSLDSLQRLLNTYNGVEPDDFGLAPLGWSQWLREGTLKVFIEITDDDSSLSGTAFETQLLAKTPKMFGDAAMRNYVFHTIAGLKENSPVAKPWAATDPIQVSRCTRGGGAINPGTRYQQLSILTGGMRFPICEYPSFDAIFGTIANDLAARRKMLCEFPLPTAPAGEKLDLSSVSLEFSPMGTGPVTTFTQVASPDLCAPSSFYIDKDSVVLCPDTCKVVDRDSKSKVQIVYSCLPLTKPNGSACAAGTDCTSGFCTDGFCCNSACGGGTDSDCQVCSKAKGATADGACSAAAAGAVCRKSGGACDVIETCDGVALSCSSNKLKPAGSVCRAASGPCDVAEVCSGTALSCPTNKYLSNTTVCRAAAGACDLAEFCSGAAATCPADQFKPIVAICRPSVGACDLVDYCTGGSPACSPDDVLPAGTVCRPQMSSCDQQEMCTGASPSCPFDQSLPDGSSCPGGVCKVGMCI